VDLDGVLDDDEAVFGVLEDGDEETADETEDEDVAFHGGVMKKYNGGGEEVFSRRDARGCTHPRISPISNPCMTTCV
jgi:hypothetical protein